MKKFIHAVKYCIDNNKKLFWDGRYNRWLAHSEKMDSYKGVILIKGRL